MTSCARVIIVVLLLGAVINFAVAWTSVMTRQQGLRTWTPNERDIAILKAHALPAFGKRPDATFHREVRGHEIWRYVSGARLEDSEGREILFEGKREELPRTMGAVVTVDTYAQAGWPLPSFRGSSSQIVAMQAFPNRMTAGLPSDLRMPVLDGLVMQQPVWLGGESRLLPFRPMLAGFIINSLLFGTIAWLLIIGPFVLRRTIRRSCGLCDKCAYPVGESPVCTECGHPLRK